MLGVNGIIYSVQYYYSYVRYRSFMLTESSLSFSGTIEGLLFFAK